MKDEFLKSIADVLENARRNAKAAVNFTMVYAYFEIGRMIVEEEQNGKNRAAYGKQILRELSQYLTVQIGKGFSVDNLKLMRIDNVDERHFYDHPLLPLRYSATHKSDQLYNMVFLLDAMEAYNRRLVKKIAVKGITESGSTATDSYIYLESIHLSKKTRPSP